MTLGVPVPVIKSDNVSNTGIGLGLWARAKAKHQPDCSMTQSTW